LVKALGEGQRIPLLVVVFRRVHLQQQRDRLLVSLTPRVVRPRAIAFQSPINRAMK